MIPNFNLCVVFGGAHGAPYGSMLEILDFEV